MTLERDSIGKEDAALIQELFNRQHEEAIQKVLQLVEIIIDDARTKNDEEVDPTLFHQNQGVIKGMKTLNRYIIKGLPFPLVK